MCVRAISVTDTEVWKREVISELIGLAVPPSAVVVGITVFQSSLVSVHFAICEKYTKPSKYTRHY